MCDNNGGSACRKEQRQGGPVLHAVLSMLCLPCFAGDASQHLHVGMAGRQAALMPWPAGKRLQRSDRPKSHQTLRAHGAKGGQQAVASVWAEVLRNKPTTPPSRHKQATLPPQSGKRGFHKGLQAFQPRSTAARLHHGVVVTELLLTANLPRLAGRLPYSRRQHCSRGCPAGSGCWVYAPAGPAVHTSPDSHFFCFFFSFQVQKARLARQVFMQALAV